MVLEEVVMEVGTALIRDSRKETSCHVLGRPMERARRVLFPMSPRPSLNRPDIHAGRVELQGLWSLGLGRDWGHPTRNRPHLIGLLEGGVKGWPVAAATPPHQGRLLN